MSSLLLSEALRSLESLHGVLGRLPPGPQLLLPPSALAFAERALGFVGLALAGLGLLAVLGAAGSLAYLRHLRRRRPEKLRTLYFWRSVLPILLRYWLAKRLAKDDGDYKLRCLQLDEKYAPAAGRIMGELGGVYAKFAQFVSIVGILVPEAYTREFRKLQDKAPPASWAEIRRSLADDLGEPPEAIFGSLRKEPLGAASLGQAHLAIWRGREVVLKVQYPDARANLRADFDSILKLVELTNPKESSRVRELRDQSETEVDYIAEAANLRTLHDAFAASPEFRDLVVVPAPIEELTRRRVLGMTYLPGPKLDTVLQERLRALGLGGDLNVKAVLDKLVGKPGLPPGALPSSPRAADGAADEESPPEPEPPEPPTPGRRVAVAVAGLLGPDTLMSLAKVKAELWSCCQRRVNSGLKPAVGGVHASNLRETARLLIDVHGFQVFCCPVFNADPHPGNILALPDGRLGLIDMGQCVSFEPEMKANFARLILLLAEPPSPEVDAAIVQVMASLGFRTKKSDPIFLATMPRLIFTKVTHELMKDRHWEKVLARDRVVEQPVALTMVFRMANVVRWTGLMVLENLSVAEIWRPRALGYLEEQGLSADVLHSV